MKIGQDLRSDEWSGTHRRFCKEWSGTHLRFCEEGGGGGDPVVPKGWIVKYSRKKAPGRPYYERISDKHAQWEPPGEDTTDEDTTDEDTTGEDTTGEDTTDEDTTDDDGCEEEPEELSELSVIRTEPLRLLSKETIGDCENEAVTHNDRASVFRMALFRTEEYRTRFGTTAMGDSARNWRVGQDPRADFLCISMKEAWTVYQKLGRRKWDKTGRTGERRTVPDEFRCAKITKKGHRCSKGKAVAQCFCTQHFNIFMKTLIVT